MRVQTTAVAGKGIQLGARNLGNQTYGFALSLPV